jgi:hypothetical protein
MAWATKCDRCGRYFDYSEDKADAFAFMRYNRVKNLYYTESEEIDLCPKCVKSLEKWVGMEEDDD